MSSSDYECCVPLAGGDGQSSSFLTVTGGIICGGFGATDWKISLSHLPEEKNTEFDLYMRCFQGVEKIPTLLSRRRAAALNPLFFFFQRQKTCLLTTWSARGRLIKQRRSTDCVFCFSPPAGASVWDFDSLSRALWNVCRSFLSPLQDVINILNCDEGAGKSSAQRGGGSLTRRCFLLANKQKTVFVVMLPSTFEFSFFLCDMKYLKTHWIVTKQFFLSHGKHFRDTIHGFLQTATYKY